MITRAQVRARDRRKLGRGQSVQIPPVGVTLTPSGSDVTIDFDRPVVINGNIGITVGSRTFVSQAVTSPTQVVITLSGAAASQTYDLPANEGHIRGHLGEGNAAAAGTFP